MVEINSKTIWILFTAILMVGSIWGYVFLAGGPTGNNPAPTDTTPPPEPTTIQFSAKNIDANVLELLPSLILTAPTNNTDVDSLQQAIKSIEGIDKVASAQFTPSQGGSAAWVFIAELQLKKDANREAIAQKLSEVPDFVQPQSVATGIISLPKTVTFTNDLNLTQQHTFTDPRKNAYLSIDTLPGDKIIAELQASFKGAQLQNLLVFEGFNITATPMPKTTEGSFRIAKLENKLSFTAKTNYSKSLTIAEQLKKIIAENGADSNSSIKVERVFPELEIVFTKPYVEQDLNTFFSQQKGVLAFDLSSSDKNSASIYFDETADFDSFRENLESELNSFNFPVKEIIEPEVPLGSEISFDDGINVAALAENLSKSFGTEGLQDMAFSRIAAIEATELTDDKGIPYTVPAGKFPAKIKLGYNEGEEVVLSISFSSLRGNATYISAVEKSLADAGQ